MGGHAPLRYLHTFAPVIALASSVANATYLQIYCVASDDVPLVAVGARSLKAEHALVRDLELLVTHPLSTSRCPHSDDREQKYCG